MMNEAINRLQKANNVLRRGNIKDAIELYTDIIRTEPENPLVYYNLGLAFIENEEYELAEKVFNQSLKLGLEEPRIYIGLGYCSLKEQNTQRALNFFNKVGERQPSYKEALLGKILAYVNSRPPEGPDENLKKALDLLAKIKQLGVWNQELSLIEKTVKNRIGYDSRKK